MFERVPVQSVRFRNMEEIESAKLLDDFREMTNLCLRTIRKNQIRTIKQAHQALYAHLRARYPTYSTAIIARAYRVALQLRKHHAQEAKKRVLRLSKLNLSPCCLNQHGRQLVDARRAPQGWRGFRRVPVAVDRLRVSRGIELAIRWTCTSRSGDDRLPQ